MSTKVAGPLKKQKLQDHSFLTWSSKDEIKSASSKLPIDQIKSAGSSEENNHIKHPRNGQQAAFQTYGRKQINTRESDDVGVSAACNEPMSFHSSRWCGCGRGRACGRKKINWTVDGARPEYICCSLHGDACPSALVDLGLAPSAWSPVAQSPAARHLAPPSQSLAASCFDERVDKSDSTQSR